MNKYDLACKRNEIARLIRQSNRCSSHRNCIRFSTGESKEHFMKKAELCWNLNLIGKKFFTEAIFDKYSGRADIIVLDEAIAYEIVKTETESKLNSKRVRYPKELEIRKIKVE